MKYNQPTHDNLYKVNDSNHNMIGNKKYLTMLVNYLYKNHNGIIERYESNQKN